MPEDSLADALAPPAQATPSTRADSLFLVSLYAAELAVLLMALALNKRGERSVTTWIATAPGVAFAIGLLVLLAASVWIGREYVRSSRAAARRLGLVVAMNLITVALIMIPLDIALRVLARATPDAPSIGDTLLLPRSWERARTHNLAIVQKASGDLSYLVYDEHLGWTVGRNRHGGDGMYLSSAEGLRAQRQGAVLAGPKDKPRVALVGDSYTFAERVTFEDSWGICPGNQLRLECPDTQLRCRRLRRGPGVPEVQEGRPGVEPRRRDLRVSDARPLSNHHRLPVHQLARLGYPVLEAAPPPETRGTSDPQCPDDPSSGHVRDAFDLRSSISRVRHWLPERPLGVERYGRVLHHTLAL